MNQRMELRYEHQRANLPVLKKIAEYAIDFNSAHSTVDEYGIQITKMSVAMNENLLNICVKSEDYDIFCKTYHLSDIRLSEEIAADMLWVGQKFKYDASLYFAKEEEE